MNRYQIEQLYKLNEIENYQFKNLEEVRKVYGKDFREIEGYSKLTKENKELYDKFIINFLNGQGLEPRNTVVPKNINFVEDVEYLTKEDEGDEYCVTLGAKITAIYEDGTNMVIREWESEEYKNLEVLKEISEKYLRFEYEYQDRKEWLHVTGENEWY